MEKVLVASIHDKLLCADWTKLTYSLKDGFIGIAIFLAQYSEFRRDKRARDLSTTILAQALKGVDTFSGSLLYGRLGVYWTLRYLSNQGILQESAEVKRRCFTGIVECMALRSSTPIQIIYEDQLFSTGIYMLQCNSWENSFEHYVQNERLLILLDESEKILTQTIKYIYAPTKMSLTTLHSVQFFLLELDKMRLCPFLTRQLLSYTPVLYEELRKDGAADQYIFHYLLHNETASIPKDFDEKELFQFMGALGLYSMLYDIPNLFHSAWLQAYRKYPDFFINLPNKIRNGTFDIGVLCGLGYGLLNNLIGNNKRNKKIGKA